MSPRARGREFPQGIMSISVAAVTENKGKQDQKQTDLHLSVMGCGIGYGRESK